MEIYDEILQGLINTPALEWAGVLIGTTYLILISQKIRWGWVFAMFSTSIYTYLCYRAGLFIETGLQVFYFTMAIYGWFAWNKATSAKERLLIKWPVKYHFINIVLSTFTVIVLGYLMSIYTEQQSPYLDAFTTVFSLAATFMAAHKVVENWIYWIIIDAGLIFLYGSREMYLTGFHYFVYTIIAIFAFLSWLKMYKAQKNEDHIHGT